MNYKTILKSARFGLLSLTVLASSPAWAEGLTHIGEMKTIRAKYEDTLVHIARAYNLGFIDIRAANPDLDPWLPGEGAKVVLPTMYVLPDAPQDGVVINLPEMRLYYFGKAGKEPETYSIGIGREGLATPVGTTTVVRKASGPTWRPTERMRKEDPKLPAVVPPGPDNPMGTHSIYLGWPTYAIHGTNKPYGIGRRLSSGCIRMYPEGISDLFSRVPVGTKVTVVDQPIKMAWIDDILYMEVHPTQKDALILEKDGQLPAYDVSDADMRLINRAAGKEMVENLDWKLIRKVVSERRGYPIPVANRSGSVPSVDYNSDHKQPERLQELRDQLKEAGNAAKKNVQEEAGPAAKLTPVAAQASTPATPAAAPKAEQAKAEAKKPEAKADAKPAAKKAEKKKEEPVKAEPVSATRSFNS